MEFKKGDKVLVNCKAGFGTTPLTGEDMKDVECEVFTVNEYNGRVGVILPKEYEGEGHSLSQGLLKTPFSTRGWWVDADCCSLKKYWYKVGDKVVQERAKVLV